MWIVNFFNELKAWRIVKKICKNNKYLLDSVGLKMDWFGRLYKVINRDVDIDLGSDEDEIYLRKDLSEIWQVLIKLNIVDILAYELKPLDEAKQIGNGQEEFEHGYLIVLTPAWNLDKQYVSFKSVSAILISLGTLIFGITYLIRHFVL